MDHNLIIETHILVDEEVTDIRSLVSRELQNLAELRVLIYTSVALKCLFKSLRNLFHIQIVCQALYRRDALATVALLHAHVDDILGLLGLFVFGIVVKRLLSLPCEDVFFDGSHAY